MALGGEIAALATALCWALSVVYFRRLGGLFSPLSLNLWKGLISVFGLAIAVTFISHKLPSLPHILWLLLSGAIGIGVGDTAFFAALNRLGERPTLLMAETLAPVFTAILAILWIGEWLSFYQWLAIAIILLGVDIVLRSKKTIVGQPPPNLSGISYAALAALCQAIGAVVGRDILINSDINPITASLIRLLGGLSFIVPVLYFSKQQWLPKKGVPAKAWKLVFIATFCGTFLAMILQMYSFANAPAAIVQSLFASCIIFSLIIAKIQGQQITRHAVFGSLLAMVGVTGIFLI